MDTQASPFDEFENRDQLKEFNVIEFQEMKMRAEAAEARLRRIYNTPLWRYTKFLRKRYANLNQLLERNKIEKFVYEPGKDDGSKVLDLISNRIQVEMNNANWNSDSFAVIAQYSTVAKFTESLNRYIQSLLANSYAVIVVSACEDPSLLQIPEDVEAKITLIRKPNIGYDFGSWATALHTFPELLKKTNLILTNDSLIGPFDSISNLLTDLENSKFDLTGITDSTQMHYHLQSYLIHFKPKAINCQNLISFILSVNHYSLKNDVILKYELGLTRTAQLSGIFVGAIFPWNLIVQPDRNPSLLGWERLIDLGFPFLKREAVRKASYPDRKKMVKKIENLFSRSDFASEEIKSIGG